jgi:hypothetical protein
VNQTTARPAHVLGRHFLTRPASSMLTLDAFVSLDRSSPCTRPPMRSGTRTNKREYINNRRWHTDTRKRTYDVVINGHAQVHRYKSTSTRFLVRRTRTRSRAIRQAQIRTQKTGRAQDVIADFCSRSGNMLFWQETRVGREANSQQVVPSVPA